MSGVGLGIYHADRLLSMVLCDCRADMPSPMGDVWNDRITSAINEGCQSLAVATTARWFGVPFMEANEVVGKAFRQTIASTTATGFVSCARAIQRLDYLDQIAKITVPTTLMVGANDGPLPQAMQVMQQGIAGAQLVVIPNAGHLPNIDQSILFNAAMMRHFFQNPAWSQA
jgi:3-oxoadipate enol-lactonase